jgi:hypothetical protein
MGRSCMVCGSPHKTEYDKLRVEGTPIKDIAELAQNKYGEKHLAYHCFQRHFADDLEIVINEQVKASKLREQVVKENIKKDIEIAKMLTKNLGIVADKIEEYANKDIDTIDDLELLLKFMGESRLIIEQFLKWSAKLEIRVDDTDTFTKIMKCIEDFPADLIAKFAERWKDYGKVK